MLNDKRWFQRTVPISKEYIYESMPRETFYRYHQIFFFLKRKWLILHIGIAHLFYFLINTILVEKIYLCIVWKVFIMCMYSFLRENDTFIKSFSYSCRNWRIKINWDFYIKHEKIVEILFQKNVQAWLEKKQKKMPSVIFMYLFIHSFTYF